MIALLIDEHRPLRCVICRHLSNLGPVVSVTFTHLEIKQGKRQQYAPTHPTWFYSKFSDGRFVLAQLPRAH
jgi:hypothetical protein